MPDVDFLTNVESSFLELFMQDEMLKEYNWQRWDSDVQLELPRGLIGLKSRRDPEESPYHRIEVSVRFEGRPKKQKLSVVMNELVELLKNTDDEDLTNASHGSVTFIGRAIQVQEERPIMSGLRTWTLTFVIYAVPMN